MQVTCQAPLSEAFAQVLSLLGEEPPAEYPREIEPKNQEEVEPGPTVSQE